MKIVEFTLQCAGWYVSLQPDAAPRLERIIEARGRVRSQFCGTLLQFWANVVFSKAAEIPHMIYILYVAQEFTIQGFMD